MTEILSSRLPEVPVLVIEAGSACENTVRRPFVTQVEPLRLEPVCMCYETEDFYLLGKLGTKPGFQTRQALGVNRLQNFPKEHQVQNSLNELKNNRVVRNPYYR